jgi:protein-ribulosamine 3-kinase
MALPDAVRAACEGVLGSRMEAVRGLSGGSINEAFRLETAEGAYFLKLNRSGLAELMATEAQGLQLLREAGPLRVPEVLAQGEAGGAAFLLLVFVEEGARSLGFWQQFGEGLAALHRHIAPQFGLAHDNFIGSLPQANTRRDNWQDFYGSQRLRPQMRLARQSGRLGLAAEEQMERLIGRLPELCPEEPPALTHGDLWSGNFLADKQGLPWLIDPAVSYAHREMDLAMSLLFGGFEARFYQAYETAYPTAPGFRSRVPVYQLYYLLVHVNLCGGQYVQAARRILQMF